MVEPWLGGDSGTLATMSSPSFVGWTGNHHQPCCRSPSDPRWLRGLAPALGHSRIGSAMGVHVRKCADLLTGMEALATAVINHFGKAPEGVPVTAKELLHLGTRAAVDQTLSRLVRSGSLIRVSRGLYVRPIKGALAFGPPSRPLWCRPSLNNAARAWFPTARQRPTSWG